MIVSAPALSKLIWILVAWLVLLHLVITGFFSSSSASSSANSSAESDGKLLLDHISKLSRLLRYTELEEIEEIPVFPALVKRKRGLHRKQNPDDPLSELSPEKRRFYFPDPNVAAVDPNTASQDERYHFFPGREWRDMDGNPIQAHGGGILYVPETKTFYWYGENKQGPTYRLNKKSSSRVDLIGISCYSSQDLWLWKHEGIVLASEKHDISSDLHTSKVLERPKVIFNDRTQQYVMWMHVDNANYSMASVGVATSSTPQGPFRYIKSMKPHGFDSRDMTIFKDDEDRLAFLIYASQTNSELHISELTDDYLGLRNRVSKVLVNQHREAPALFKHQGLYYMITSGCTGWFPNQALVHAAESILGPWETLGDPCVGASEEFRATTFFSQVSFVLPLPGLQETFIFIADRWNPGNLSDSRYVWLPLTVDGPADEPMEDSFEFPVWSRVSVRWHRKWKLPPDWNSTINMNVNDTVKLT